MSQENNAYNFLDIENKWRDIWEKNPINVEDDKKPKFYCLDMFPYPSGTGLHVGHWRGYVLSDVVSRYKVLQGYQVLHPMGWDAFGLPAENFAIKNNIHPKISTADNIKNVKRQLHDISAIYDWDKEVNTTDPEYYKWTQWIFIKMFEKGLAYEKEMPLNWCPSCKCVLANEEAAGGSCDRCHTVVTKKNLRQWMLKITAYADRLLDDLNTLDWSEKVKKMQADWIGKSHGAEVDFALVGKEDVITVYTTRPDTLYGCSFMVVAPEYSGLDVLVTEAQKSEVEKYCFDASTKSSVDRMTNKEKTGVFTGTYATNPVSGEDIPIWVADYVLADYGTGAVMCVPAHDERDFDFATKFNLPIRQVILPEGQEESVLTEAYVGDGIIINSGDWNGMKAFEAKKKVPDLMEEKGIGKKTTNYKLRDWVFSRQRYWGEPIPIIHCDCCGAVAVPEKDLPVILPEVDSYKPTDTGESPLAQIDEWVNTTCPTCGKPAKRETNTMPQWAGSSWYFLRYMDNHNTEEFVSMEALKKWSPIDLYVGGIEHAVLHLLYARFYTKFLYDIDAVPFIEPFQKLFNQGMITKNGIKMSKSVGNVVSPDDLVERYGCDSLRMYELFVGPPELDCEWDDSGIDGVFRFLNRTWKLVHNLKSKTMEEASKDEEFICNKLIQDITNRLEALTMNTVVSGFMEHTNHLNDLVKKQGSLSQNTLDTIVVLLAPFAPHISEELWKELGHEGSVFAEAWPVADESKLQLDTIEIAMQIGGKLRGTLEISTSATKEEVLAQAKEALASKIDGKEVIKEIYVPNKIVNLIVK